MRAARGEKGENLTADLLNGKTEGREILKTLSTGEAKVCKNLEEGANGERAPN